MYTYHLSNKSRVDMEKIVDAVLFDLEFPQWHLDTETGTLIEIYSQKALKDWVEEIGGSKRYYLVERFTDEDRNMYARSFIVDIMQGLTTKADKSGAVKALDSGGWRDMETYLREHTDGWIDAWDQYIADKAWEYAHEWLTKSPHFFVTAEFEGCGNCAICELMRKGEDRNPTKLLEAFATEEAMQNVAAQANKIAKESKSKTKKQAAKTVAKNALQLKIMLSDSKPPVWRRILVPDNYSFFALHVAIQDAMGWFDCHLHEFFDHPPYSRRTGGTTIKLPHPDDDAFGLNDDMIMLDERTTLIRDFLKREKDAVWYMYDFGDGWKHKITLEKIMPLPENETLPKIITGKNRCPFEDSGALFGYYDKIAILKDKNHPEHHFVLEWVAELEGYAVEEVNDDILTELSDVTKFDINEIEFNDPEEVLEEYEDMRW